MITLEQINSNVKDEIFCEKDIESYLMANPDTKFKAKLHVPMYSVMGVTVCDANNKKEAVCHFIDDTREHYDFKKQIKNGHFIYKVTFASDDKNLTPETMYWEDFLSYIQKGYIKLIK